MTEEFQVTFNQLLTVDHMVLQAFPDVEFQSTEVLSHVQQRVLREATVFAGPLGSRRDSNT